MVGQDYDDIEALANDRDALAKLVRDNRMYREALDAIPDPVVIHDSEKRYITSNKVHREQLKRIGLDTNAYQDNGHSFEDSIAFLNASPLAQLMENPGDIWFKTHIEAWNKSLETGKMVERQELDGSWLLYGVNKTPSNYYVDYRTDISQTKILQTRLKQVLDNTNQGVAFIDENDNILLLNDAAKSLWDIEEFELQEGISSMADMLDKTREVGSFGSGFENYEDWLAVRKLVLAEVSHIPEDGFLLALDNGRHIKMSSRVLPDGSIMYLHDDMTEIERQKAELETAKKKAELAERAKSEFLANMSHEIRTPMNGVMGMAELLMRTDLDAKQHSFADTIVKSGSALLTIINDILDFSKIDAGQMTLNPAPFKLTDAIEDVATLISSNAAEKGIELAVRIDRYLPETVIGDVGRIRQIVTNLLGNAVKFTDEGDVLVDISGEPAELDGHENAIKLRCQITDTGIGIPPEKCAAIFEKFQQVDGSAARRHEGTGLGLSITSSLVELMGGTIGVESEVGKGSKFWFDITLPAEHNMRRKTAPVDVTGARILIIDDNQINRSILSEQMVAWNFKSKACKSGREGLALAVAANMLDVPFDLVILDYQMPEITGDEVARSIRNHDGIQDTPIILLTSVDHAANSHSFEELGLYAQLTKPSRSSLLLETIVAALQEHRANLSSPANAKPDMLALNAKLQNTTPTSKHNEPAPAVKTRSFTQSAEKDVNILIIEDNEVNQLVFSQTLKSATHYNYEIANNGEEGINLYEASKPDLILMDVSMPIMNGLEATERIRKIESATGVHTPIIGITAHAISGDQERCLEAGMDDYLSKPISPNMLLQKIETWMHRTKRKEA